MSLTDKIKNAVTGNSTSSATASSGPDKEYHGFAAFKKQGDGGRYDIQPFAYPHKKFAHDDLEVKIEASGICGSDLHTIREEWGDCEYPAVVGHEIVGRITRLGSTVTGFEVGQRVGFGAQAGSCLSCDQCSKGWENLCPGEIPTYQGKWEDGSLSQGGYSDYYTGKAHFAIPIPDGLPSDVAAPLLCAGITTYSPLKNHNVGPGKKVAVAGVGGLGHLGLQWAVALGANVTALSHQEAKRADCEKMGVHNFVVTGNMEELKKQYERKFDFILVCNDQNGVPVEDYSTLLAPFGVICIDSLPEQNIPSFNAQSIAAKNACIAGSHIGPPNQIREMLQFAVEKGVRTWVDRRPLTKEGIDQALSDVAENRIRYRAVLVPAGVPA